MHSSTRPRRARRSPMPFAALLLASALTGCAGHAPDPQDAKQSLAEFDIARDLWLTKRDLRGGLDHALKASELDPTNAEIAHSVSLIYLDFCSAGGADCRLPEAEKHARRALALQEDFREARNTLGVVLIHSERLAEAVTVLQPLTEDILYRTPENAWGNLGWAYLGLGRLDEAIDALSRSVAAQPLFCVGYMRLGDALSKKGRLAESLDAYTTALETDQPPCKRLQEASLGRARLLRQLGQIEQSRQELQRCLSVGPNSAAGKECRSMLGDLG